LAIGENEEMVNNELFIKYCGGTVDLALGLIRE
jgi:hypothetical protein